MNAREQKFLHAFSSLGVIGSKTLPRLKEEFGSFEQAWNASNSAFGRIKLSPNQKEAISQKRSSVQPDRAIQELVRERIWIIDRESEEYPRVLREIPDAPFLLYAQGERDLFSTLDFHGSSTPQAKNACLAIVGTRKPTAYGLEVTEKITRELTDTGITIASGLASGIDAKAHKAALDNKGKTIAVLGSGIDRKSLFPKENIKLADRIVKEGGLIVSEYPPGTPGFKENFPQRNRIISGISQGVLVIEAREKSGALITARFALEQNREVFAIPGSMFSKTAEGPNRLIQEGAKLVMSAKDILEEFGIEYEVDSPGKSLSSLNEKEMLLLDVLQEPLGVDSIKIKTKLDTASIIATLSMLELKGIVKNMGGDMYAKI